MSGHRLDITVTLDPRHGYVATTPELRSPVTALSLGGLRKRIEALMGPAAVLKLDRAGRQERDQRRQAQAQPAR